MAHKFTVGQVVGFLAADVQPGEGGDYVIIRLVSDGDADPRYRIKSKLETQERVVCESELTPARPAEQRS